MQVEALLALAGYWRTADFARATELLDEAATAGGARRRVDAGRGARAAVDPVLQPAALRPRPGDRRASHGADPRSRPRRRRAGHRARRAEARRAAARGPRAARQPHRAPRSGSSRPRPSIGPSTCTGCCWRPPSSRWPRAAGKTRSPSSRRRWRSRGGAGRGSTSRCSSTPCAGRTAAAATTSGPSPWGERPWSPRSAMTHDEWRAWADATLGWALLESGRRSGGGGPSCRARGPGGRRRATRRRPTRSHVSAGLGAGRARRARHERLSWSPAARSSLRGWPRRRAAPGCSAPTPTPRSPVRTSHVGDPARAEALVDADRGGRAGVRAGWRRSPALPSSAVMPAQMLGRRGGRARALRGGASGRRDRRHAGAGPRGARGARPAERRRRGPRTDSRNSRSARLKTTGQRDQTSGPRPSKTWSLPPVSLGQRVGSTSLGPIDRPPFCMTSIGQVTWRAIASAVSRSRELAGPRTVATKRRAVRVHRVLHDVLDLASRVRDRRAGAARSARRSRASRRA